MLAVIHPRRGCCQGSCCHVHRGSIEGSGASQDCRPASCIPRSLWPVLTVASPSPCLQPLHGETGVAACALTPSWAAAVVAMSVLAAATDARTCPTQWTVDGVCSAVSVMRPQVRTRLKLFLKLWPHGRNTLASYTAWCGLVVCRRRCCDASKGGLAYVVQASGCHRRLGWTLLAGPTCGQCASAHTAAAVLKPHGQVPRGVSHLAHYTNLHGLPRSLLHPVLVILGQGSNQWLSHPVAVVSKPAHNPIRHTGCSLLGMQDVSNSTHRRHHASSQHNSHTAAPITTPTATPSSYGALCTGASSCPCITAQEPASCAYSCCPFWCCRCVPLTAAAQCCLQVAGCLSCQTAGLLPSLSCQTAVPA
jgi:hypothetical protein